MCSMLLLSTGTRNLRRCVTGTLTLLALTSEADLQTASC